MRTNQNQPPRKYSSFSAPTALLLMFVCVCAFAPALAAQTIRVVADERARVATEGWGARLLSFQGPFGRVRTADEVLALLQGGELSPASRPPTAPV